MTFYHVISRPHIPSSPDILAGGDLSCRLWAAVTEERPQEEVCLLALLSQGTKVQFGDGEVGQVSQGPLVQCPHLLPGITVTLNNLSITSNTFKTPLSRR